MGLAFKNHDSVSLQFLSEGKIIILYSCIELADWQSDEQRPHVSNLPPSQFLSIHRPSPSLPHPSDSSFWLKNQNSQKNQRLGELKLVSPIN